MRTYWNRTPSNAVSVCRRPFASCTISNRWKAQSKRSGASGKQKAAQAALVRFRASGKLTEQNKAACNLKRRGTRSSDMTNRACRKGRRTEEHVNRPQRKQVNNGFVDEESKVCAEEFARGSIEGIRGGRGSSERSGHGVGRVCRTWQPVASRIIWGGT